MRCFYHETKEAVGMCKSCCKGLCAECAVDLSKGLACRNHCEESVKTIIDLVERNIQLWRNPAKAQLVVPPAIQRGGQPTDYIASQLTAHIRDTRKFRWGTGTFCSIIGALLFVEGLVQEIIFVAILGACFVGFAGVCFVQARRSTRRPRLPETQTR
jgi:hypothetical protein